MSSAFALVRFPDGRVRAGVYHGTSDVLHPWLWDSIEEAWDHPAHMRDWNEPPEGVTYEVTVFSDYGRGFYWPAHAAWNVVLDNLMPYEHCYMQMAKGRPEWVDVWLAALTPSAPPEGKA